MCANKYRIENVLTAVVNGQTVKLFGAYERISDSFVFCGVQSAPENTANEDLWKFIEFDFDLS